MRHSIVNIAETKTGGRSFVGVSNIKDSDKTRIVVPYGYEIPSIVDDNDIEDINRLRRFVKAIQKALHSYVAKREDVDFSKGMNNPLSAVNIIRDYLAMGTFVEYEKRQQQSDKGKINFKQTVKKIRPSIFDKTLFYESFIVDKKGLVKDSIVALAQGNIINHFMSHGGDVLFGQSLEVPVPKLSLKNHHIIRLLQEEQNNTFNSRKQNLIRWSIDYIQGLLNPNFEERGEWNYAIVASSLWEIIVDSVFGNQRVKDKTQFGKIYRSYSITDNSELGKSDPTEHDTIYEDDGFVFVIDSKMYANWDGLLSDDVLGKQFGYYCEAKRQRQEKKIVNVLFLPHIWGESGFQDCYIPDPHTSKKEDPYKFILLYTYSVNELVDDYYFGRKRLGKIKEDFITFISKPEVSRFLKDRGASF